MTEIPFPELKRMALEAIIKRGDDFCLKLTGFNSEQLRVASSILYFNSLNEKVDITKERAQISKEDFEFVFSREEIGTDNKNSLFNAEQMKALCKGLIINARTPHEVVDIPFLGTCVMENLSNDAYATKRTPIFSAAAMNSIVECMQNGYPIKDYINLPKCSDNTLSNPYNHDKINDQIFLLKKAFEFDLGRKSVGDVPSFSNDEMNEISECIFNHSDALMRHRDSILGGFKEFNILLDIEKYNAKHPGAKINLKDFETFLSIEVPNDTYSRGIDAFKDILIYNASHPDKHIDVNRFFDMYKESKDVWTPAMEYMDEDGYKKKPKFCSHDLDRASDFLIFEAEYASKQADVKKLVENIEKIDGHMHFREGQGKKVYSYNYYLNNAYLDTLKEIMPINQEYEHHYDHGLDEVSLRLYPLVNIDKEGNVTLNKNVKEFVVSNGERSERNLDDERDEL